MVATACTLLNFAACSPKSRTSDSTLAALEECEKHRLELQKKDATILELTDRIERHEKAAQSLQTDLEHTRAVLAYAERQFISLEQGLQSYETKASAVAALAEARLTYDKRLRDAPRSADQVMVREALKKIQESDEMIVKQRYAASVYFAKSALRLLENQRKDGRIRVVTVNEANVRRGPGTDFAVVAQVTAGTVLIELENRFPWFRIETDTGLLGWVHDSVTTLR